MSQEPAIDLAKPEASDCTNTHQHFHSPSATAGDQRLEGKSHRLLTSPAVCAKSEVPSNPRCDHGYLTVVLRLPAPFHQLALLLALHRARSVPSDRPRVFKHLLIEHAPAFLGGERPSWPPPNARFESAQA